MIRHCSCYDCEKISKACSMREENAICGPCDWYPKEYYMCKNSDCIEGCRPMVIRKKNRVLWYTKSMGLTEFQVIRQIENGGLNE